MPDREKTIKDIEECLSASCRGFRPRKLCPYNDEEWDIMRDALVLLKEQESVEPIPPIGESDLWECGYCHHQIFRCTHQRYCEMCGREVKWK